MDPSRGVLADGGRGEGRAVDGSALAAVLDEFTATVTGDFTLVDILRQLAVGATRVLDVDGAGVARPEEEGGLVRLVFATDEPVRKLEEMQEALQVGPCCDAVESRRVVNVAHLASEGGWPGYQHGAEQLGINAVAAIPLVARGRCWGVLDLYRLRALALSEAELAAATTLANLATSYLVVAHDRDVSRQAQDALSERAMHDGLTGLPMRWVFLEHLEHALQRLRRNPSYVAVLFVDLDGLKWVNDMYGHAVGDQLIVTSARRFREALRPTDLLARMGGDEFVVLLEDVDGPGSLSAVARRMLDSLDRPWREPGLAMHPSASIGIAWTADPDTHGATLIAHADSAMYQAKRLGRGGVREFDPEDYERDRDAAAARDRLAQELRAALAEDQLEVHYQPIVDLEVPDGAPGRLHAVEALLRWRHPQRGLVNAGTFIDAAERSGLLPELGAVVLQRAICDFARWRADHEATAPRRLFVNVSTGELVEPQLVRRITRLLGECDVPPQLLTLEITESGLMQQPAVAAQALAGLRALGCELALDDFGTGYSSLSRLIGIPATTIKIDQSFSAGLDSDPHASAVISTIRTLGEQLGRAVVAEGVETEKTLQAVAALGIRYVQGYHLGLPVAPEEVAGVLRRVAG